MTAHSLALIAQDTILRGDVTIGQGCIIHPRATIDASLGPIVIGSDCVVEEMAVIRNRRRDTLRIGDGNYFMVGSRASSFFHPSDWVAAHSCRGRSGLDRQSQYLQAQEQGIITYRRDRPLHIQSGNRNLPFGSGSSGSGNVTGIHGRIWGDV